MRDFVTHIKLGDNCQVEFPSRDSELKSTLAKLSGWPSMSSGPIGAIINQAVRKMSADACYLNIGTWHGFTLFAGMIDNPDKNCIGVDNFSESGGPEAGFMQGFHKFRSPQHKFFKEDYREYFKHHTEPIGVYYYDGPHTYEDQLDGLLLAEPFLIPGAIVMVDDTNGARERKGTFDFLSKFPLDFEILADLPTPENGHWTFHNGLIVLRKTRLKG